MRINPELGTPEDYEGFVSELHRHGMRQILDIVPNHMGVMGSDNAWWLDVLENGEASDFADFFDIDWDPIKDELQGKVLIPVLADQYGNVLERGDLKLTFDSERGEFSIFYSQHRFPVDPKEYPHILGFQIERLQEKLGPTHEDFLELQSIMTAFSHLPDRRGATSEQKAERNREKEVQKHRLATLCARSHDLRAFIIDNVTTINGTPEDPRSFDVLHELIKAQPYRFAQWRVAAVTLTTAASSISTISLPSAPRTKKRSRTHKLILGLVAGKIDGLRVDHPDSLYDPARYFEQLRGRHNRMEPQNREAYLIAEKSSLAAPAQRMAHRRHHWLRVRQPGQRTLHRPVRERRWSASIDRSRHLRRIRRHGYQCKKHILKVVLASELNVLANLLIRIALASRYTCDFT
jgi:(1->4)-alpha-D-glucan 1-alpha-D-glucosylmutase